MAEKHLIGRERFELEFYSQRSAHRLQSMISRLANDTLHRILGDELDRVCAEGEGIRFDQLVVDVGDIPYDRLEAEFPPRFEAALRRMLGESVEKARLGQMKGAVRTTEAGTFLQALAVFLVNGDVPWWKNESTGSPEHWLDALLKNQAAELVRMLRREGKKRQVRKRLAYQFPIPMLERVVYALEPADAAFIIAYAHDVESVHRQKPLVRESAGGFERVKWEIIFAYLLADRGSVFNRRAFIKGTLKGLAAHYNIAYHQLLKMLSEASAELSKKIGFRNSLPELLQDLYAESAEQQWRRDARNDNAAAQNEPASETKPLTRDLDLLRYFLLHGSFPLRSNPPQRQAFPAFVQRLLHEAPSAILLRLRAVARFPEALKRYIEFTSEPVWRLTVEKAEPAHASVIIGFTETVKRAHEKEKLTAAPLNEFTRQVWEFVLDYLLVDRGSYFNTRMFVYSNLKRIAAHYNLRLLSVILVMKEAAHLQKASGTQAPALLRILDELVTEEQRQETKLISEDENSPEQKRESLRQVSDALHYFLHHGAMPWWAKGIFSSDDVRIMIQRLLDENDEEALRILRDAARHETAFHRLEERLDDESVSRYTLLAEQREAPVWDNWLQRMEAVFSGRFEKRKTAKLLRLFRVRLMRMQVSPRKGKMEWQQWLTELLSEAAVRFSVSLHEMLGLALEAVEAMPSSQSATVMNALRDVHEAAGDGLYRESSTGFGEDYEEETVARVRAEEALIQILAQDFPEIPLVHREWLVMWLISSPGEIMQAPADLATQDALNWLESFWKKAKQYESSAHAGWNLVRRYWLKHFDAALRKWRQQNEAKMVADDEQEITDAPEKEMYLPAVQRIEKEKQEQREGWDMLLKQELVSVSHKQTERQQIPVLHEIEMLLHAESLAYLHLEKIQELFRRALADYPAQLLKAVRQWSLQLRLRSRLAEALNDILLAELLIAPKFIPAPLLRDVLRFFSTISVSGFSVTGKTIHITGKQYRERMLAADALLHRHPVKSAEWLQALLLFFGAESGIDAQMLARIWEQEAQRYASEWRSDFVLLLKHLSEPGYLQRMSDRFLQRIKALEAKAQEEKEKEEAIEREKERQKEKSTEEQASSWIHNAGLILLWPYLPQLFRRLGYVKGNRFEGTEMAQRAVMLLQYLCTKENDAPEYELVLNKLLCGVKQTEPMKRGFEITDEEKSVCEDLIRAVLRSWPALKTTTPEGFRVSFLVRNGKIANEEEKWMLRVEQKAFDKLLSMLPWSISIIRLPWMEKSLYTEWKH